MEALHTEFSISLDFFSGPMDLLLHLVQKQEVAVEEVEMSLVAEQYLKVIDQARYLDLERASEYLVIAATLVAIKSQRVLPAGSLDEEDADSEWAESDFLEELRERIRQYELTKKRALALRSRPNLGLETFARKERLVAEPDLDGLGEGTDAATLADSFRALLKRIGASVKRFTVRIERVSVIDYMMRSIDALREKGTSSFTSLVVMLLPKGADQPAERRGAIIGSFIAVLELTKRGLLTVTPGDERGSYSLALGVLPDDGADMVEMMQGADALAENTDDPMPEKKEVHGV